MPPTYKFEHCSSWFFINHRNIDNHFTYEKVSCPSFLLDKILKEYGHDCLMLPAYHADLNSIELIWATMKGYIARRNVSFKMTDIIQLTQDAIVAVTEDDWASSCRHVEEVERKYWDADIAVEEEMEKIVIQVTSSDEDTDTATECSDYSDT